MSRLSWRQSVLLAAALASGACGGGDSAPRVERELDRDQPAPAEPAPAELTREVATPPAPTAAPREDCDALPTERPAALTVAARRTILPRGANVRRETAEVVDDETRCTEGPLCRVVASATLDRIYALALRHAFSDHVATPLRRSPHFGARSVHITWSDGSCTLGESSRFALDERGHDALQAVFDAVVQASAEGSPASP